MGAGHLGTERTLTADGHYHPQIVKDSSGYLWRKGEEGLTTPTFYAQRSTNTNDDSSWNTEQTIGYDTEGYGHLMLVPMGSGQLMALYNDATSTAYNLKYSIYDGSWGGQPQ